MPADPAGAGTTICVSRTEVKLAAGTSTDPKLTRVAPVKAVPVMVTAVPPARGPLAGLREVTAGRARTVRLFEVAAAVPVPKAPVGCPVVKAYTPGVVEVTPTTSVQLAFAGMVTPDSVSAPVPTFSVAVPPEQVEKRPAPLSPEGRVAEVIPTPVRFTEFGLSIVTVTAACVVPFAGMLVGAKLAVKVGGSR